MNDLPSYYTIVKQSIAFLVARPQIELLTSFNCQDVQLNDKILQGEDILNSYRILNRNVYLNMPLCIGQGILLLVYISSFYILTLKDINGVFGVLASLWWIGLLAGLILSITAEVMFF